LFVALSVSTLVRSNLQQFQDELQRVVPFKALRWARAEQFHLTLRFLGGVQAERVDDAVAALLKECRLFAPLQLTASGLGSFPKSGSPRVLWVGVEDQSQQLERLWKTVQTVTQPFTAEPPERHFVGHITLARLNGLSRPEAEQLAEVVRSAKHKMFGQWTANSMGLFSSELSSQGARHSLVAAIPLIGK
jgi:2'-5' RNA ligase